MSQPASVFFVVVHRDARELSRVNYDSLTWITLDVTQVIVTVFSGPPQRNTQNLQRRQSFLKMGHLQRKILIFLVISFFIAGIYSFEETYRKFCTNAVFFIQCQTNSLVVRVLNAGVKISSVRQQSQSYAKSQILRITASYKSQFTDFSLISRVILSFLSIPKLCADH